MINDKVNSRNPAPVTIFLVSRNMIFSHHLGKIGFLPMLKFIDENVVKSVADRRLLK
jgi:hypothetical protein